MHALVRPAALTRTQTFFTVNKNVGNKAECEDWRSMNSIYSLYSPGVR